MRPVVSAAGRFLSDIILLTCHASKNPFLKKRQDPVGAFGKANRVQESEDASPFLFGRLSR